MKDDSHKRLGNNYNIVVVRRLFPLPVGGRRTAKPTILWFSTQGLGSDFWRLDRALSGSENRLHLCAFKLPWKHAGFCRFLRCSLLRVGLFQAGCHCFFCCCFFALCLSSAIRSAQRRQIYIYSPPSPMAR